MTTTIDLVERGLVPDLVTRWGIRRLLGERLRDERARHADRDERLRAFVQELAAAPIAVETDASNEQHYELPAALYERVLGPHLKYSGCYWPEGSRTLEQAEAAMLRLTCERARLADGQEVLELGCGWGSLSLWLAEHYPRSRVLSVSNSASQREFILARARDRGLDNLAVETCDMNAYEADRRFDRIVSVEMFEHMRNWPRLLERVRGWLVEDGRVFLHVFAHREYAYRFETEGAHDWMGRYFFTGGMMPSDDLLEHVLAGTDAPLAVEQRWVVDGRHYARTAEAWLANTDAHASELERVLAGVHGPDRAKLWLRRWRLFFMACAELFAFRQGREWWVSHALLRPTGAR